MDLDEFNLTVRKLANKLNNSLIDLEFIVEKIEKMNNNERLELEKQHNNKSIRRIQNRKDRRVGMKIMIFSSRMQIFKDLNNYEKEKEVKEMTRKIMDRVDIFESKIKNIRDI